MLCTCMDYGGLGMRTCPKEVRDVGPVGDPKREEEDREDDATPLHRRRRRAEAWGWRGAAPGVLSGVRGPRAKGGG